MLNANTDYTYMYWYKQSWEKTEREINNEQSKDSGTIGYFSPLRLNIIVIISILLFVYTES